MKWGGYLEKHLPIFCKKDILNYCASQFVTALKAKPIQDNLKLIVFNACYMETFAEKSLAEVPCVIGTKDSIPDETAMAFSKNFYFDLANGCSVKEAFDRSISLAEIKNLPKTDVPILLGNGDIRFRVEEKESSGEKPIKNDDVSPEYKKSDLRKFLIDKCNAEEFETLCGDLQEKLGEDGVKLDLRPEALGGKTIQMNAKNLIDLMERRSLMKELIQFLKAENIL